MSDLGSMPLLCRRQILLFNVDDLNPMVPGPIGNTPPSSAIRIPALNEDMASWPPDVFFDAAYAMLARSANILAEP
ncbi:hypothetical protein DENSPDRAFT_840985 [Dentipellis sp. KUC8613]|nr:hypothetical protein DENSPDRAFT_840985 [Dentipellis sp. KUC8613]